MGIWESELNDADQVDLNTLESSTYETLQDWFNSTQSSGVISGGGFTDNGDGTITVAAGTGFVKTADNTIGDTVFFDWDEDTSVSLTDNSNNFPYIDYNSGSPTISATTDLSTVNFTTQFAIGIIYREGTILRMIEAGSRRLDLAHRILMQDYEVGGFQRASGLVISETGTRNIAISAGSFYFLSSKQTLSGIDTSGTDTFAYYYRDGAGGWTKVASQTQIDNTQYDDGDGALGALGNNRYGVHWIYQCYCGEVSVVYGQGNYNLAEANDAQPPTTIPGHLSAYGYIVGKIIIQKDATSFVEVHSAFDVVFTPSVIINHNDLANIQGGTTDEYYHLTSSEHTELSGWLDNVVLASDGRTYSASGPLNLGAAASTSHSLGVDDVLVGGDLEVDGKGYFDDEAYFAGNVGIGNSSLESWDSAYTALQIGGNASLMANTAAGASGGAFIFQNAYWDGNSFKAQDTDETSVYELSGGRHAFKVSNGSVTADTEITWLTALAIDNGGTMNFGTHSAVGAETVTGYITIKDAGGTERKLAVIS